MYNYLTYYSLQQANNAKYSNVGQMLTYENTGVAVNDHGSYEETELNQGPNVSASMQRAQENANAIYEPIQQ